MHRVEPKVFLVGETMIHYDALDLYFKSIGTKFKLNGVDTAILTDSELMIELMGRLCYRSWEAGLNPNVTKIREGNAKYLKNIIESKHGSVLEHVVSNWILQDVSRVFTHELVRHRAGTAFSQESLRYVRLEDLGLWLPPDIRDEALIKMFENTFKDLGELQVALAKYLKLDESKDFHYKKTMTSLMRRVAPIGLATSIGVSFNMRALRHIGDMRTQEGAEVEIRLIMDKILTIAKIRWPNIFFDFSRTEDGTWTVQNSKV